MKQLCSLLITLFACAFVTSNALAQRAKLADVSTLDSTITIYERYLLEYVDDATPVFLMWEKRAPGLAKTALYLGQSYAVRAFLELEEPRGSVVTVSLLDSSLFWMREALRRDPNVTSSKAPYRPVQMLEVVTSMLATEYLGSKDYGRFKATYEKGIADGVVSDLELQLTRDILESCDSNAILLTHTLENATFSTLAAWYLQTDKHVRPDVSIVQTDLLVEQWYQELIRARNLITRPVSFTPLPVEEQSYRQQLKSRMDGGGEPKKVTLTPRARRRLERAYRLEAPMDAWLNVYKSLPANCGVKRVPEYGSLVAVNILAENAWERPIYTLTSGSYIDFDTLTVQRQIWYSEVLPWGRETIADDSTKRSTLLAATRRKMTEILLRPNTFAAWRSGTDTSKLASEPFDALQEYFKLEALEDTASAGKVYDKIMSLPHPPNFDLSTVIWYGVTLHRDVLSDLTHMRDAYERKFELGIDASESDYVRVLHELGQCDRARALVKRRTLVAKMTGTDRGVVRSLSGAIDSWCNPNAVSFNLLLHPIERPYWDSVIAARQSTPPEPAPAPRPYATTSTRKFQEAKRTAHDDIYAPNDPLHLTIDEEGEDSTAGVTLKWYDVEASELLATDTATLHNGTVDVYYTGPRPLKEGDHKVELLYRGKFVSRAAFEVLDVDALSNEEKK